MQVSLFITVFRRCKLRDGFRWRYFVEIFVDVVTLHNFVKFPAYKSPSFFFGRSIAALQLFWQPFLCLIANGMQFFLGSLSFFFCTKDIQVQCTLSGTMCLLCHYLWMADGLEVILFQDLDAPITANDMAVASSKLAVRSILLSFVWFLKVCLRFAKATWISSP